MFLWYICRLLLYMQGVLDAFVKDLNRPFFILFIADVLNVNVFSRGISNVHGVYL